ncbi:MAG: DUF3576 domain-containing protein [Pseudomonadota bacterium]
MWERGLKFITAIGGLAAVTLVGACSPEPTNSAPISSKAELRRQGLDDDAIGTDGSTVSDWFLGTAEQTAPGAGIRVNKYMWQGALDTLNFLPVEATDPFSGVIATGWGSTPEMQDERFKITVYVTDVALEVSSLRVAVFREVLRDTVWVSAPVDASVPREIEDAILTRARQIRISEVEGTPLVPS